ncbi:MAG: PD40 domain-containing protein [Anaerolineales bacterium]|nr:PD40 domain-containing protein [Anaerolineales bacterium]
MPEPTGRTSPARQAMAVTRNTSQKAILLPLTVLLMAVLACRTAISPAPAAPSRSDSIPTGAVKGTPANDPWPPLAAPGWSAPVPLEGPVNTAGVEDSPFIPTDGSALYFFFTPDPNIPAQRQLGDGQTGIWMAPRQGEGWGEPIRIWLNDPGELALDGCGFVLGNELWFCSARVGNQGEIDLYTAHLVDGVWSDWQNAGPQINFEYDVGELHITADGRELYFGSQRDGGFGGSDLWVSTPSGNGWGTPANLGAAINGPGNENRPYVTPDGGELWFDGEGRSGRPGPSIYRCLRQDDDTWDDCQEIIAQFAGEPALSPDGNTLYFVHHYFSDDLSRVIETDLYVSNRLP